MLLITSCFLKSRIHSAGHIKGTDVSVGANGTIFLIGKRNVSSTGGYNILYLKNGKFITLPHCAAVKIAVSPDGIPWVVNKSHLIYKYIDSSSPWQQMPGTATDIAIGANGSVYAIGTKKVSDTGGYNIMKWNGEKWNDMPDCAGIHIAVDPNGIPWVVNKSNIVYRYSGKYLWNPINGVRANDIGIGADGSIFITAKSADEYIYKLNHGMWVLFPDASGSSISVTPDGRPVYIDKAATLHNP